MTLALTSFLLARITEDEAAALAVPSGDEYRVESTDPDAKPWRVADHYRRHQPARVLAECEAKRLLVGRIACPDAPECGDHDCVVVEETWRILATVYADHADYDEAWRP